MPHRRGVHGQDAQRVGLVQQDGQRVALEQRAVALLRRQDLLLHALALGDVLDERAEHDAVGVAQRRDAQRDRELRAVAAQGDQLHRTVQHRPVAALEVARQPAVVRFPVAGRHDEVRHAPPDRLRARPTEGRLRPRVPRQDQPSRVHQHDGVERRLQDAAHLRLAGPQRLLREVALGDVVRERQDGGRLAGAHDAPRDLDLRRPSRRRWRCWPTSIMRPPSGLRIVRVTASRSAASSPGASRSVIRMPSSESRG